LASAKPRDAVELDRRHAKLFGELVSGAEGQGFAGLGDPARRRGPVYAVEGANGVDVHSIDDRQPQHASLAFGKRAEGRLKRVLERLTVAGQQQLELGISQSACGIAELFVGVPFAWVARTLGAPQNVEGRARHHRTQPCGKWTFSRVVGDASGAAFAGEKEALADGLGDLVFSFGAEPKSREGRPKQRCVGLLERRRGPTSARRARVGEEQVRHVEVGDRPLLGEVRFRSFGFQRTDEVRFVRFDGRVRCAGIPQEGGELRVVHLRSREDYHAEPMACLDESTVVDLLGQNLPEAARRSALAHVETCEACRELLVALSSDEAFFPTEPAAGLDLERSQSPAGEAFGSYRLLRPVGEGGVGIVYAAVDERTGVVWALKVLKDVEGSHTARFRREAKVGATLSHPSIANVHEVVEHEGRIAIVSPLLHGESLDRRLYRQSPLPVAGACRVLAGLAGALAFAHQNGVVHRDVKPQNVFLVGDPLEDLGAQEVKLLDFGLAKAFGAMGTSTQLTETGVVLGTPHYMAPEQILGAESVSTAADVWALGVVAYECLSGIRPIEGKSFGQIFKRLTQERVVPLSTRVLDLPPQVVALVDALLAMAPGDRPSAEEAHTVLVDAVP